MICEASTITVDIYEDKENIVCELLPELEEFIEKVLSKNTEEDFKN